MHPRFYSIPAFAILTAVFSAASLADVVTFTNGAVVRGTFLGGDSRTVRIEVNNKVEIYRISEVAHIQFGDVPGGGGAGAAAAAQQTASALGVQPPAVAAPQVQAPAIQAPQVQAPAVAVPQVQAPQVQAPQVQAPAVAAPKVEAPKPKRGFLGLGKKKPAAPEAPQVQAPQVQAPAVQAPAVQVPSVQAPAVQVPAVQAPAVPAPVAAAPPPGASAPPAQAAPPTAQGTAPAPVQAAAPPAPPPQAVVSAPPQPAAQQVPLGGKDGRTIPAGAFLQVRMIDSIDTTVHKPGEIFRASLENALAAAGDVLAPSGSDVNIRLVQMPPASGQAGTRYRLEAVSIRLGSRNLPMSAEALPFVDPVTLGTPWENGLAKISLDNDATVTFRVLREFRIP